MAKKKRKFWAGFCDGEIAETRDAFGNESNSRIAAIYIRRKDAKKAYEDVRPVEVKEIK